MSSASPRRRLLLGAAAALAVLLAAIGLWPRSAPPAAPPIAAELPAGEDPPDAPTRALLGEVVAHSDGRALAGVEVRATLEDGGARTAVTDREGAFALDALPARVIGVRFKAAGFEEVTLGADAIPDAPEAAITQALVEKPGEAPLDATTALELIVADTRGRPITSYVVTLSRRARDDRHGREPPLTLDVNDPAGRVLIPLAPGAVALTVVADGYRPSERTDAEIPERQTAHVRVALDESSEVRGVVVDKDSQRPIAGAEVSVAAVRGAIPVFTNDEGRFVLRSVVEEHMSLTVRAAGYLDLDVGGVQGARSRGDSVKIELSPKREGLSAEVVGIGVTVAPHRGGVLIRGVIADGPAAGKLEDGDVVIEADGVPLEDLKMRERIASIRGAVGTEVELAVRKKDGAIRRVKVERARVAVPDG